MENAYFLLFGWLQEMHISYFVDCVQRLRFAWNYAFLVAPRFQKYAFFHVKMHIFAFRLAAEINIHILLVLSKTKVFMNYEVPRFQIYAFSMRKCIFVCFSAGCRNAYFIYRWFCPKTKVFMELCILMLQDFRHMHYSMWKSIFLLSAGCRKCIIPYFW